jgi:hypothetical protein
MPRYYFDLVDGDVRSVDEEGIELFDLRAVGAEATKSLADMIRDTRLGAPQRIATIWRLKSGTTSVQ